jgi:hypothetical protein
MLLKQGWGVSKQKLSVEDRLAIENKKDTLGSRARPQKI